MDPSVFLFYLFAAVTVFAALRVVTARNPVHSALFLVLTFFSCAAIWLMLEAEFLAITLVLVYVGAVMVLFLFVVMMLDINVDRMRQGFWKNLPVAAFVGAAIVLELAAVLWHQFGAVRAADAPRLPADYSNTKALGRLIYTEYVYAFEIAAVILLVAIVAAIALTLRRRKDSKYVDPAAQIRVRRQDRVRIVSMPTESVREESAERKGA
ncbi:MAG TPA: NADH-quinone oxidoreductase subunit J [Burkholderiaceae bacterium]|nr:NADH-quinone oxidoreductase subunit J [Burkholderiaceae bacterium]